MNAAILIARLFAIGALVAMHFVSSPVRAEPVASQPDLTRLLETVHHLSVFIGPRPSGSPQHGEAVDWISDRFREIGYEVSFDDFILPDGGGVSHNVIARLPGSERSNRPFICIGGHLDSVRNTPGADDNASGIAVILEAARLMKSRPLPFDIVWVAFGSEERYMRSLTERHLGSRHRADQWESAGRKPLAMMSVDMIGVGPGFRVRSRGTGPDWYWRMVVAVARKFDATARYALDVGPFGWSDHERFEANGVPVAWIERRPNGREHTPRDTFETVRGEYLVSTTRIVTEHLAELAKRFEATSPSARPRTRPD